MISGVYNFTADQGATFERHIEVKNSDGTIFDLTGYSARMQIRRDLASTEVLLELTNDNGRIVIDPAAGSLDLYISASDSSASLTRDGVYDLEIFNDPYVYRLIRGEFRVNLEVTR